MWMCCRSCVVGSVTLDLNKVDFWLVLSALACAVNVCTGSGAYTLTQPSMLKLSGWKQSKRLSWLCLPRMHCSWRLR